jgi:thiosulfate reductase cytochrome b subunit
METNMKNTNKMPAKRSKAILLAALGAVLIGSLILTGSFAQAQKPLRPEVQGSPLHPTYPLLDGEGQNVLESGAPVSTMTTCGACHDTDFIEQHSFHTDVGLNDFGTPGSTDSGRAWDTSPGLFGKWNPIQYRYLSPAGDDVMDLGTPEWLMTIGVRHVGGGPAVYSQNGNLLTDLAITPGDPQTHIVDAATGGLTPWDWDESGVVEMNCFLCHTQNPDNESRMETLHAGDFKWANAATLVTGGIVESSTSGFNYNPAAFDENGELRPAFVSIQDPTNDNCGLCHGLVHDNLEDPLITAGCAPERWRTITTGQIISPQKLLDSGMNLANKAELNRSWDIHAERLLNCTDCHYSLNNPLYYQEADATRPDHLTFDPRRVEIGEYLVKPLHQFARGDSAQGTLAPNLENTMRRCDSCHATEVTHSWLPYTERHMNAVSCETCHIPQMYSSANQTHDWTVIHTDGSARLDCRGVEGDQESVRGLLTGYEPVWMPNQNIIGETSLAPYNLVTAFFWVYADPPRPVRLADLEAAYLEDGAYIPGILLRFDANEDGVLDDSELKIDTLEKEQFVTERLTNLGLDNPRIMGEVQPYSINHTVANGEWAIRDCQTCHSAESRVNQGIQLANFAPGGVTPTFVGDTNTAITGEIITTDEGALFYQPDPTEENLYVLGQDKVQWVDTLGLLIFLGTLGGLAVHGGLRIYAARKTPKHATKVEKVYMYGVYERLWHWLQTFAIVLLIFTGLVIHRPDTFGIFSFSGVVLVHNIVATVLGINAVLSLFFHLASGEIQQYLPRPRGFFDQSITQAKFYLQGIFKGAEHPFEKTPDKKLNPLQQLTYFAILNVLLPLQGITGILIWGAQRWPNTVQFFGGLPGLAPFHTLIAWLFTTFVVMHVYLTTTGHTPMAGIKAMMMGWEDMEVHVDIAEEETDQ